MERQVLLSIVIANFNYGRFLEEAIQSILAQSCQDFELIIVDGGSSDNSVDIIRDYAAGLPPNTECPDRSQQLLKRNKISWWTSEPDNGQSDAFNKGFSHAKGRFLTWLNADDVLLPHTLERFKVATEKKPECEWFVGGVLWLDPNMKIIKCGRGRPFSEIRYQCGEVSAWGSSSFFTKRMLHAVGGVDNRFHYMMDTDLWLKFAHNLGKRYLPFTNYAWGLRLHPQAKMSGQNFANSPQQDPHHPKWEQYNRELLWLKEIFPEAKKLTKWNLLRSISWCQSLAGRYDSYRYKGMLYSEVFR